jgi:hypothetical protein
MSEVLSTPSGVLAVGAWCGSHGSDSIASMAVIVHSRARITVLLTPANMNPFILRAQDGGRAGQEALLPQGRAPSFCTFIFWKPNSEKKMAKKLVSKN